MLELSVACKINLLQYQSPTQRIAHLHILHNKYAADCSAIC